MPFNYFFFTFKNLLSILFLGTKDKTQANQEVQGDEYNSNEDGLLGKIKRAIFG